MLQTVLAVGRMYVGLYVKNKIQERSEPTTPLLLSAGGSTDVGTYVCHAHVVFPRELKRGFKFSEGSSSFTLLQLSRTSTSIQTDESLDGHVWCQSFLAVALFLFGSLIMFS